jgi:hypothetical protein
MGRMLKNTVFKSASYALGIPVGSSTITPDSPTVGQTLWNSSTNKLEYYNGTIWEAVAHEGNVTLVRDSFTGNNVQTDFNMSISYSAGEQNKVLVFVGTVVQQPTTNYVFTGGAVIQFLAAPSSGSDISVIHNLGSTIVA